MRRPKLIFPTVCLLHLAIGFGTPVYASPASWLRSAQVPAATSPQQQSPEPPKPVLQGSGQRVVDARAGDLESKPNQVSLSIIVRSKRNVAPDALQAAELTVQDGAHAVPERNFRISEKSGAPLLTLVFGNLEDADTRRAADVARKVLKQLSELSLPVAVLQIGDHLRLVQAYTTDRGAVDVALRDLSRSNRRAVEDSEAVQEKRLSEAVAQGGSGLQQDRLYLLAHTLTNAPQIANKEHLPAEIATLTAAAQAQKGVLGRKILLLFTIGTPEGAERGTAFRSLYEHLADASVSLYVIDVRGLDRNADQAMLAATLAGGQAAANRNAINAAPATRPGTNPSAPTEKHLDLTPPMFRRMTDTITQIESGDIGRQQNPLASIASATGGQSLDTDTALNQLGRDISADLRHCYTLTFPMLPAPAGGDRTFHPVEMHFPMKDVLVASPLGYFGSAAQDVSEAEAGGKKAENDWAALIQGSAAKNLTPSAGVRWLRPQQREITVQIPVERLALQEEKTAHTFSLHASFGAELQNSKGITVARFIENVEREGSLENESEVRKTVLRMSRTLDVPAGKYKLHAVVRDWLANTLGETTLPITLGAEEKGALGTQARPPSKTGNEAAQESAGLSAAALNAMEITAAEQGLTPAASTSLPPERYRPLIETARVNALSYADLLPNFLCVERIDRSTRAKGSDLWKHRDAISELLRVEGQKENRTVIAVNGEKSSVPVDRLEGSRSHGEFGGILQTIFNPDVQTSFHFERALEQGTELLYAFSFQLLENKSEFVVTDETGAKVRTGLHGVVYISAENPSVRRLLVQTDELPSDFGVRSSWMTLHYGEVAINTHDYLLPVQGEVGLQRHNYNLSLMQLRFGEYRRFGSRSVITYPAADQTQEQRH